MGLETFGFISDLNPSNPDGLDQKLKGDDHIRGVKLTLQNTFPNLDAAVTGTPTQLNNCASVFGAKSLASADDVVDNFPAGTKMLFQQTAAPTGWTKVTASVDDRALRVVSGAVGSGGATGLTSVFGAGKNVGAHAITSAEMPSHTHGFGTLAVNSAGAHTHDIDSMLNDSSGSEFNAAYSDGANATTVTTNSDGAHTHTLSGALASTGSGNTHTHTLSLDLQYLDCIIATKD